MTAKTRNAKRRVRSAATSVREAAQEQALTALEKVVHAAELRASDAQKAIKREVRQRPVAITATALGIGVIAGLVMGNGRHGRDARR